MIALSTMMKIGAVNCRMIVLPAVVSLLADWVVGAKHAQRSISTVGLMRILCFVAG